MIPSLNYAILIDALHALKDGDFRHCESLGFTFDEMNILNQLSLDELFIISRESVHFMTITVHHDTLSRFLARSREEVLRQRQINRAIQLGGSIALMNFYFGLTSNEVSLRRRLLKVSVPFGRTPDPDEETDTGIWQQWQKYRVDNLESSDALEAMMLVTEKLSTESNNPSLTVVWNRITLYERKALVKETSHARRD
ncbi:DUF2857 domain-containing protein [Serratia marcescens]|uniref:DUF2857 domain-containing protein n=1 Tax=Serratia marcescens TaxID=615 RepID=UPI002DB81128|nr:DUF2857 domain-containing protein [Serratia marcescens]MEB6080414.1 DUF2857 domain-containing protein [Serratia marcescens]